MKGPLFAVLIAIFAGWATTVVGSPVEADYNHRVRQEFNITQKTLTCTKYGNFRFNKRMVYKYKAKVANGFTGTNPQTSNLQVFCTVHFEVPKRCHVVMKVPSCSLRHQHSKSIRNSGHARELNSQMARFPVEFDIHEGQIVPNSLRINREEPLHILNIKRAIMSSVQLTVRNTKGSQPTEFTQLEEDVNGLCRRSYTSQRGGQVITTATNITSCVKGHRMTALMPRLSMFNYFSEDVYNANVTELRELVSSGKLLNDIFHVGDNIQTLLFPLNSHVDCKYTMKRDRIKRLACLEQHVFPFMTSQGSYLAGAMANISKELLLTAVQNLPRRRTTINKASTKTVSIEFGFDEHQGGSGNDVTGAFEALKELVDESLQKVTDNTPKYFERFVSKVKDLSPASVRDALDQMKNSHLANCLELGAEKCNNATKHMIMHYWRDALFATGSESVVATLSIVRDMGYADGPLLDLALFDVALNHDVSKETINHTLALCQHPVEQSRRNQRREPTSPYCLLPLSIMIRKYKASHVESKTPPTEEQKKKCPLHRSISFITEQLKSLEDEYDSPDLIWKTSDSLSAIRMRKNITMQLKAISNIGGCDKKCNDDIFHRLFKILDKEQHLPREMVYTAIRAFRGMNMSGGYMDPLLAFALDRAVGTDMRIAAYRSVMVCMPDVPVLRTLLTTVKGRNGGDRQFTAYVHSHLKTVLNNKGEDEKTVKLKDAVKRALNRNEESLQAPSGKDKRHLSGYFETRSHVTIPYTDVKVGVVLSADRVFDRNDILPRRGVVRVAVEWKKTLQEVFEVGVSAQGYDALLESVFGPTGYFKQLQPLLLNEFRKLSAPLQADLKTLANSIMSTGMEIINYASSNPFDPMDFMRCLQKGRYNPSYCQHMPFLQKMAVYVPRMMGNVVQAIQKLKQEDWSRVNPKVLTVLEEIQNQFRRTSMRHELTTHMRILGMEVPSLSLGDPRLLLETIGQSVDYFGRRFDRAMWHERKFHYAFTKSSNFYQLETRVPTGVGLPLNLSIDGVSVATLRGGMNASGDRSPFWRPGKAEAYFKPSFAANIHGRLQVSLPMSKLHTSGLHIRASASASPSLHHAIVTRENDFSYEWHSSKMGGNLMKMTTQINVLDSDGGDIPISGNKMYQTTMRHCSPQPLTELTGQEVCVNAVYQNATGVEDQPWFPIAGENEFSITSTPKADVLSITTRVKREENILFSGITSRTGSTEMPLGNITYEWNKEMGLRSNLTTNWFKTSSVVKNPWFIRGRRGHATEPWLAHTEFQIGDAAVYMMDWNYTQIQIDRRNRNPETDPYGSHILKWSASAPDLVLETQHTLSMPRQASMEYNMRLDYQMRNRDSWLYELHPDPVSARQNDDTTSIEVTAVGGMAMSEIPSVEAKVMVTYPGNYKVYWDNLFTLSKYRGLPFLAPLPPGQTFQLAVGAESSIGYHERGAKKEMYNLKGSFESKSPVHHFLNATLTSPAWFLDTATAAVYMHPKVTLKTSLEYGERKHAPSRHRRSTWLHRLEEVHNSIIQDVIHLFGYDEPLKTLPESGDGWNTVEKPWLVHQVQQRRETYFAQSTLTVADESQDVKDRVYAVYYRLQYPSAQRNEVFAVDLKFGENSRKRNVYYGYYANMTSTCSAMKSIVQSKTAFIVDHDGVYATNAWKVEVEGWEDALVNTAIRYNRTGYRRLEYHHDLTSPVYNSKAMMKLAHGQDDDDENIYKLRTSLSGYSPYSALANYELMYNISWLPNVFFEKNVYTTSVFANLKSDVLWDADGFDYKMYIFWDKPDAVINTLSKNVFPYPNTVHLRWLPDKFKVTLELKNETHGELLHLVAEMVDRRMVQGDIWAVMGGNKFNPATASIYVTDRNTLKFNATWDEKIAKRFVKLPDVGWIESAQRSAMVLYEKTLGDLLHAGESSPARHLADDLSNLKSLYKTIAQSYAQWGQMTSDTHAQLQSVLGRIARRSVFVKFSKAVKDTLVIPAYMYTDLLRDKVRNEYVEKWYRELMMTMQESVAQKYEQQRQQNMIGQLVNIEDTVLTSNTASVVLKHPLEWDTLNTLPQLPPVHEVRLNRLKKHINGVKDFIAYKNDRREFGVPPSFYGMVFGANYSDVITFDGKYYKIPECPGDTRVLVHDFVNKNVTVLLEEGSLTLITRGTSVSVETKRDNPRMIANNNYEVSYDFPHVFPSGLTAVRDGYLLKFTTNFGLQVVLNFAHDIILVELNGWYYGKTAGILGTSNRDPTDDTELPQGGDLVAFYQKMRAGDSGDTCKASMPSCFHEEGICEPYFAGRDSSMASCFKLVDPAPFLDTCHRSIASCVSDICPSAIAYASMCEARGRRVDIPQHCVSYDTQTPVDNKRLLDVVFVVSLHKSMEKYRAALSRHEYPRDMAVKAGMVAYGLDGVEPSFATADGRITVPDHYTRGFTDDLQFEGTLLGDSMAALRLATTYPFRKGAVKVICLVTDNPQKTFTRNLFGTPAPWVQKMLALNDITLNVLMPLDGLDDPATVGINYNWNRLSNDVNGNTQKVDVFPENDETYLARTTKGMVFDLNKASELGGMLTKMFRQKMVRQSNYCTMCSSVVDVAFKGVRLCKSVPCN